MSIRDGEVDLNEKEINNILLLEANDGSQHNPVSDKVAEFLKITTEDLQEIVISLYEDGMDINISNIKKELNN